MTEAAAVPALRFEILGPVRAFRGADAVDLGPAKQRAVLALLLLHAGEPVPVHRIVAALWGTDPPENGVDVVQRYIGGLRRALDPGRTSLLALTGEGYVLRVGENAVDAHRFRAGLARARAEHRAGNEDAATGELRHALALWQDEPLAGLTGPVFESARARLNEERAGVASHLAHPPAHTGPAAQRTATPAEAVAVAETPTERPPVAEPPAPKPPAAQPAAAKPPAATEPTRVERAPARPAHPRPAAEQPAYAEPVDPWAGHDLFPPDPLSMG